MTYTSKKIRTNYLNNMDFKKIRHKENNEDIKFVDEATYLIDDVLKDKKILTAMDEA